MWSVVTLSPSAASARLNIAMRSAARTRIAIRPSASFQPGRLSHDILKAERICAHYQSHNASIVFTNHVSPSSTSRNS